MASELGYIPRIAGGDMSQYDGKLVTLMGQVVGDDGTVAQVKSADGTTISVQRAEGGGNPYSSPYVEIVERLMGVALLRLNAVLGTSVTWNSTLNW